MAQENVLDFREIAKLEAGDSTQLISVIEKELIHHDILRSMSDNGFMQGLCFQGGTSLRLCYQSERFSEDLNFTGGLEFSAVDMEHLKICIQDTLTKKYGLLVEVKPPKAKNDSDIAVSAWQVKIVTAPDRPDIPSQKIKIEVANVPSYTRDILEVSDWYQRVANAPLLVPVQSMEEVMADKLLALPASINNIRYRDIWDLHWMSMRRVKPNLDYVAAKISDYKTENYHEKLELRLDSLKDIIEGNDFMAQMTRFLKQDTIDATLGRPEYRQAMFNSLNGLLSACLEVPRNQLNSRKTNII